jgi:nucleoside-specific outer membrane channel protein Tsx
MPKEGPKRAHISGLCKHGLVNVITVKANSFTLTRGLHMTVRGIQMNTKRYGLAALILAAAAGQAAAADLPVKAPPPAPVAPFFFVNDNSFSYHYEFDATDPLTNKTAKQVVSFTHFDVWAYGTNFFNIDLLKSDHKDPANPCVPGGVPTGTPIGSCAGATEIYGFFRSTLGFNEIFNTKAFSMGPLMDVSFEFGADANSENNFLAPAKRDVVAGLEFTFALPYKGHFNISPLYYKEWNHNAFLPVFFPLASPDGNTDFNGTWAVEMNYAMPLGFVPWVPLTFSGYANFYGPKGTDAPGDFKTAVEFHSEQKLSLDIGQLAWSHPNQASIWVGYRYWHNKFGIDGSKPGNTFTTESTALLGATVTF